MWSDSIKLSFRKDLMKRSADLNQIATCIEHVVDNDDVIDFLHLRIANYLHFAAAATLLSEAVSHDEAHPHDVGHSPRELHASAVGSAHKNTFLIEIDDVLPNKVRQVPIGAQLVQHHTGRTESSLGLVVQVHRHKTFSARRLNAPEHQLWCDGLAGHQFAILPRILQARHHHRQPMRGFSTERIHQKQQSHQRKVHLSHGIISDQNHEHVMVCHRLQNFRANFAIVEDLKVTLPRTPMQMGNNLLHQMVASRQTKYHRRMTKRYADSLIRFVFSVKFIINVPVIIG
mmetsp:Transcript_39588/g.91498  ORF Transcript_39588/g.91498 Transcript_39588/m.91498 type:complete len:287 (-) Transcript_39588:4-864(-)